MGNRASSRSKEEKKEMFDTSLKYINNNIESIEEFKKELSLSKSDDNQIVVYKSSTNKLLDIMKKQLQRNDKALVKADIVAIIISLKPELVTELRNLDSFTVKQLNTMLRSIVYDINRIKNQYNIQVKVLHGIEPRFQDSESCVLTIRR